MEDNKPSFSEGAGDCDGDGGLTVDSLRVDTKDSPRGRRCWVMAGDYRYPVCCTVGSHQCIVHTVVKSWLMKISRITVVTDWSF